VLWAFFPFWYCTAGVADEEMGPAALTVSWVTAQLSVGWTLKGLSMTVSQRQCCYNCLSEMGYPVDLLVVVVIVPQGDLVG